MEAIVPCDLLSRAGVDVRFAGIGGREITGGHGITVCADCAAEETDLTKAEMLVLPGGLGGVASIQKSETVKKAVIRVYEDGGYAAAIRLLPKEKVVYMETGEYRSRAFLRNTKRIPYDRELLVEIPSIEDIMYFLLKAKKQGGEAVWKKES